MADRSSREKVQLWIARLTRFSDSQQSVSSFCSREGVTDASFYYLRQKLTPSVRAVKSAINRGSRAGKPSKSANNYTTSALIPVTVVGTTSSVQQSRIHLPGGVEIDLGGDLNVVDAVLRQVLASCRDVEATGAC